ncbi:hypothetical protein AMJ57_04580 [Parcubacteria bacterium SG8_24]|nr:MAG: hypothetical protein AMJ57_04580 [Parcubacteria bacterium SG8_24]
MRFPVPDRPGLDRRHVPGGGQGHLRYPAAGLGRPGRLGGGHRPVHLLPGGDPGLLAARLSLRHPPSGGRRLLVFLRGHDLPGPLGHGGHAGPVAAFPAHRTRPTGPFLTFTCRWGKMPLPSF